MITLSGTQAQTHLQTLLLAGKTNCAADATSRNLSPRMNDYADDVSQSLCSTSDKAEVCNVAAITDDVSLLFSLSWLSLQATTASDGVLVASSLCENGFLESR